MAIKHHLDKEYHERLAKLLLENSLPDVYPNLVMQDRPDLYLAMQDEGIEVVRAMLPDSGSAAGQFKRMKNKSLENIPQKDFISIENLGYRPLVSNGKVCGYGTIEAHWVTIVPLQNSYSQKIKKLPHYDTHSINSLFIFSPLFNYYDERDVLQFYQWVQKTNSSYPQKYDKVFLYDEPVLYLYHSERENVLQYKFPQTVLHELCVQAQNESL